MKAFTILFGGLILCTVGLRADPVPGEFFIDLNTLLGAPNSPTGGCNPLTTPEGQTCVNQWGANRDYMLMANSDVVNPETFSSDFISPAFCFPTEVGGVCTGDPDMDIDLGGYSPEITSTPWPIHTATDCPNGICDFINKTGQDWHNIVITTSITGLVNEELRCDGGNAFQFCGFQLNGSTLEIAFLQGNEAGIVSSPEPASWPLLLTGLVGIAVLANRRKIAPQRA